MTFVHPARNGRWEVRESRRTAAGPRSRTLASFAELTPEVVDRALERSSGPLDRSALEAAALRAGAPIADPPPDRTARELLAELSAGNRPRPALRRLLYDALGRGVNPPSDAARAAAAWIPASLEQRGAALRDLLLLADRLPAGDRGRAVRFPRLDSGR